MISTLKKKIIILGECYEINETNLSVNNRGLTKFPESIGELVNLQNLWLRNNKLTS